MSKKMRVFNTSLNKTFFAVSFEAFQEYFKNHSAHTAVAVWAGDWFINTDKLVRVGRGVYVRESF